MPRFGYDRPGRVVKIDARKKMAIVAIGQMQWDVAIDDLIPQVLKAPGTSAPRKARPNLSKVPPRLEDFQDEPGGG